MADTEVAKRPNSPLDTFDRLRAELDAEAGRTDSSVGEWIRGKLAAIMEAGSFEEINALMTSTGLTAARDLVGRTLRIDDFAMRETGFEDSKAALEKYCIVKATDPDSGEEFIIDGGGDQFVAGIVSMRRLYGFPFTGTLLSTATQAGYDLQYWRFQNPGRPTLGAKGAK